LAKPSRARLSRDGVPSGPGADASTFTLTEEGTILVLLCYKRID
jgi:hypothetical protein